jgi:hypothetical protein
MRDVTEQRTENLTADRRDARLRPLTERQLQAVHGGKFKGGYGGCGYGGCGYGGYGYGGGFYGGYGYGGFGWY